MLLQSDNGGAETSRWFPSWVWLEGWAEEGRWDSRTSLCPSNLRAFLSPWNPSTKCLHQGSRSYYMLAPKYAKAEGARSS